MLVCQRARMLYGEHGVVLCELLERALDGLAP
jgi:hypothetical protein